MVDWRDVTALQELMTSVAVATIEEAAQAFTDKEARSLIAETKKGERIVAEFKLGCVEWSDPEPGGEMRVREIDFIYINGDPQPRVALCGLNGITCELITMDASRSILKRYALALARVSRATKVPS